MWRSWAAVLEDWTPQAGQETRSIRSDGLCGLCRRQLYLKLVLMVLGF